MFPFKLINKRITAKGTAPENRPCWTFGPFTLVRNLVLEMSSKGTTVSQPREVRAPRGTELNAKSWQTEAPLRMLMNNLSPAVAELPGYLVCYGVTGSA